MGLQTIHRLAAAVASFGAVAGIASGGSTLPENPVWDFIVVGGGTGGGLAASRLGESGASVLLLEAGPWDEPWIYEANAPTRDRKETIWGYPIRTPGKVHIQNSPEFRHRVAAGKVLGGSSTVHQDVYNRPPTREFEYFGFKSWTEQRVAAAFKRIEEDLQISWFGYDSMDDIPDPQFIVLDRLVNNLGIPHKARPHSDGTAAGASIGWWMYRSCPPDSPGGVGGSRRPGCKRHTSYLDMVAQKNATKSDMPLPITTLPRCVVKRVLIEDGRAVGVEVLRNGRLFEIFARRAVVLAAGALGTPKILTLSGIGDPLEMQKLAVPVQLVNREVGQNLADHLATFTWFLLRGNNDTDFGPGACDDREFFHTFFNITEPHSGGHGLVDSEVRYYTGCNFTRQPPTVDFGIEAVLLHPESRGRVIVTSPDPEVMPLADFPTLWDKDYDKLEATLATVAKGLGLTPDDLSSDYGVPVQESVRKNCYLYQHLCCSARAAVDGEPGVCDENLRVRGISNLYVADASALPTLPSSHTSAAVLLLASFAAEHMVEHAIPHPLPVRSELARKDVMEAFFAESASGGMRPISPTVPLPMRPQQGNFERVHVDMPLAGLGTGTIAKGRVSGAVASFLRSGGRHLDTAAMYDNYAEMRDGIEASGLLDTSEVIITGKMMPLGRDGVLAAVKAALAGLGVKYLDVALLHWPGDLTAGKLMHGKPNPACVEVLPDGSHSWHRCRVESYVTLLEERAAGRIHAVGVSNFAVKHLDALQAEGYPPPAVHQLELHPFWRDDSLLARHAKDGALVMGYGCLGGAHVGAPLLRQTGFKKIAERLDKSVAQVLLRWGIQHKAAVVAGGSSDEHLKQNLDIFDFELNQEDMDFMNSNPPNTMSKMYLPKPDEIV